MKSEKLILAGVVLVCFFTSNASFAQPLEDCGASQHFADIYRAMGRIQEAVESVPPDEAAYMRNETKLALAQSNRARYTAVASRRYFFAMKFHDDAKAVLDNIGAAEKANAREMAGHLIDALAKLVDLGRSMDSYVDADRHRTNPILKEGDPSNMYYYFIAAEIPTAGLLKCLVGAI